MIQLGLDIPIYIKGYFTLEKDLLNKSLFEMETLLGFETGRLRQGADILILQPPTSVADFEIMGTTVFPGHRMEDSPLHKSINSNSKKEEDLRSFRRKRLLKVIPLTIHLEAMRKHLNPEEYQILKDTDRKGKSSSVLLKELRNRFKNSPKTIGIIERNFMKSEEIYERVSINDELYPSAKRGIYQWKLNRNILARCVCRLTNYHKDIYSRTF